MTAEHGIYEGRKGQKRLKAIEKQIASVNEEFDHRYAESREMKRLSGQVEWVGTAGLVFSLAQRDVNFKWNGMMDYGFIRLCDKWLAGRGISFVDADTALQMMGDILPAEMSAELRDELAAIEIV